jgi:hypothetical protein
MKRRALALCASLLLVGLVPGSTLAIPTSNLDQHNDPAMPLTQGMAATDLAQTFTAGKSGLLSGVDLYIIWEGPPGASMTVSIEATTSGLPTGPALASASSAVSSPAGWVHFSFPTPLSVVKDTVYAIVFPTGLSGAWYGSTDTYPGGQAFMKASPASPWDTLADPADFAFRTYVDTVGTQLLWDKPQITAGTSTPLTLTATMTYANGVEATHYGALLKVAPPWFTPTGITCSDTASKIVPADCTVLNFWNGFVNLIPASATGDILTFTVTGTAAPASTDVGTPGTGMAVACIDYPALTFCGQATASVDVIAAATAAPPTVAPPTVAPPTVAPPTVAPPTVAPPTAAPPTVAPTPTPSPTRAATPPPTSTGVGPTSDDLGGTLWLLPLALVALFGGLLVLDIRRRRLIS